MLVTCGGRGPNCLRDPRPPDILQMMAMRHCPLVAIDVPLALPEVMLVRSLRLDVFGAAVPSMAGVALRQRAGTSLHADALLQVRWRKSPRRVALVAGVVVLVGLAGCGSAPPENSADMFGNIVCESVVKLRNGGVANVEEGGKEAVWAETNAALASAADPRFTALAAHVRTIKDQLTDGNRYVGPGEFDMAVVAHEIEAAANECVQLDGQGLLESATPIP